MRLDDFYPIIVTDKLVECRDFYVRFFDLAVAFEAGWLVFMTAGNGGRASLAFMHPEHPSAPPGPEPFRQRRFGLFDPAGVWIDVVQQIEPAAGFWERYPPAR
jgi:hypothetical protein